MDGGTMLGGVNWPEAFIGFGLGVVPLAIRQAYILVAYYRHAGRRKFLGKWWMYHRSTGGSGKIYERAIVFKYSLLFDRLSVYASDQGDSQGYGLPLKYLGEMSPRRGMVRYITLRDKASHERLNWYIVDPFFQSMDKTVGLYLALDLRGFPAAGPMLISRARIPVEELDSVLDGNVLRISTDLLDWAMPSVKAANGISLSGPGMSGQGTPSVP